MTGKAKLSSLISLNVLPVSRIIQMVDSLRLCLLLGCIRYSPGSRTDQAGVASHQILTRNQTIASKPPMPTSSVCSILFDRSLLNDPGMRIFSAAANLACPGQPASNSWLDASFDVENSPSQIYPLEKHYLRSEKRRLRHFGFRCPFI